MRRLIFATIVYSILATAAAAQTPAPAPTGQKPAGRSSRGDITLGELRSLLVGE